MYLIESFSLHKVIFRKPMADIAELVSVCNKSGTDVSMSDEIVKSAG